MKQKNFKLTKLSCFVGIFVQAIVCNITAILFIPLMNLYDLSYVHLGILVAVNFASQVAVDIIFSGIIDRYGYRRIALPAILCAVVGLILFSAAPLLFDNVFIGIVIATIIFAASSGLLEVLVSPIVDSLPADDKGSSMSLMHSFYAWGQVGTIVLTTLFIFVFGSKYWQIIVLIWSIVPMINFIMFYHSSFPDTVPKEHRIEFKTMILKPFYIMALLAIFFGAASEVIMNQWTSTFMEKALELPKVVGDLLGACGFAIMLGIGRLTYGVYGARINLNNALIGGSLLGAVCYITVALCPINSISIFACALCGFATSLLWPGTLVVSSERYPTAGAWMFAILAAAGDIGGAVGPYITGLIADYSRNSSFVTNVAIAYATTPEQVGIRFSLLVAAIFPILTVGCHIVLKKMKNQKKLEC